MKESIWESRMANLRKFCRIDNGVTFLNLERSAKKQLQRCHAGSGFRAPGEGCEIQPEKGHSSVPVQ